jgi:hypothetical protein
MTTIPRTIRVTPAKINQLIASPRKTIARIAVRNGELFFTEVAFDAPTLSIP